MGIESIFDQRSAPALGRRVVLVEWPKNLEEKTEFGDKSDLPLRVDNNIIGANNS